MIIFKVIVSINLSFCPVFILFLRLSSFLGMVAMPVPPWCPFDIVDGTDTYNNEIFFSVGFYGRVLIQIFVFQIKSLATTVILKNLLCRIISIVPVFVLRNS